MERWLLYALLSMLFAGFTSVIAKQGLVGISAELGLTVRTLFVTGFVLLFAALAVARPEYRQLRRENYLWLALSALTTTFSWLFYYKALKIGDVARVALVDKGSVLVAMLLAWLLLREAITPRMLAGAALILSGLLVVARK